MTELTQGEVIIKLLHDIRLGVRIIVGLMALFYVLFLVNLIVGI